jgi:hypothetical protein
MVAERLRQEEAEAERLIMDEINQQSKTLAELEINKNNKDDKMKTIEQEIAVVKEPEIDSETKDEVVKSLSSVLDHKSSDVSPTPSLKLDVDHMPDTVDPFLFDIVSKYIYIYIYICVSICISICTYICVFICIHIYMYTYTHVNRYKHIYICHIYICMLRTIVVVLMIFIRMYRFSIN